MQDIRNTVSESLAYTNGKLVVVRMPMTGSYAIPLMVRHPKCAKLLAWSFLDFSGENSANPSCLLVIQLSSSASLDKKFSLTIGTNFADRHLYLGDRFDPLSQRETSILSRLLLETIDPGNANSLGPLLPALTPELDNICASEAICELTCLNDASEFVAAGLNFVPNCIVVRTSSGYVCAPLKAVRIHAGGRTALTPFSTLPIGECGVGGAILSGNRQFAVARIIEAA